MIAGEFEDPRTRRRPQRSYMEIRVSILRAVRLESSPTRVMRRANLSWKHLAQFLPGMVEKGLVVEVDERGRRTYFLTPHGNQVLRLFDLVNKELSEPEDPRVWTLDGRDEAWVAE